jgi:polyhydroxyalkanoic acid synthase PhaR subunit
MSEMDPREQGSVDPFAPIIQFSDMMMKSWSDVLSKTVASESFAQSMGQQMEGFMEATKLMRQQMKVTIEQYSQQMNLPTREQIVSVAERLTNVEMRVDDVEAKLDECLDILHGIQEKLAE